uniref:GIT ArfGAP 1 n=1 Tax=Anas zonorhyncha TaxID=75864 RepID=A0A8B9U0F9_9AVES
MRCTRTRTRTGTRTGTRTRTRTKLGTRPICCPEPEPGSRLGLLHQRYPHPAADPGWASINRGVLICDECCSVHRSLGRHISIVKHLRHSPWPATLLQMVHTLASNGANSIWEHSLLDPAQVQSGRRKANPQDKVHPTKSEFIRAKYQMLAFVHKLPCRDDDGVTAKDLSKQLHSSVRTGNLETCLRLLSLGAQANFFHPEKGTTPLHVAAKAGQILQAELLVVYGADPGAPDVNGRTPIDYARQAAQHELAERLVECQYELTDRLAFYLCGRKPDHKNGHYIIPQMADSLDLSELAKAAKKKLQALSNRLFEELAMDVYDEVDRRENDAVWLTTQNHSTLVTERSAVPFLPVNPEYSATRNQGRQKLARFNAREFATLLIDILGEAKRRQQGKSLLSPTGDLDFSLRSQSDLDDQHDYDSVASDEDTDQELLRNASRNNRARSMDSSDLSDGPITLQEYLEVKKALAASEAKVQQLMKVNNSLSDELRRLQREIHKLQSENTQIRQQTGPPHPAPTPSERPEHGHPPGTAPPHRRDRQAFSMYEPGSALKPFGQPVEELVTRLQPFGSSEAEDEALYSMHIPASVYRMRKGPSASSMPFPPSSPLLSCPPDGARHMVTYWGGFGVGGPRPRAGFGAGQGFDTPLLPYRANWTGTAAAPTATTTTPRRARSCLGERRGWGLRCHPALGTWGCGDMGWALTPGCLGSPQHGGEAFRGAEQGRGFPPRAGPAGRGAGSRAAQHGGRHPQNRAGHQEHPGAAAGCTGVQARQVVLRHDPRGGVRIHRVSPPPSLTPLLSPQLRALLGEDPLGRDGDGISLPQGRRFGVPPLAPPFPSPHALTLFSLQKPALETVRSSLRLLNASAYRLQSECRKTVPPEPGAAVDYQLLTQQVIQCAYDIAKAAKQLVTITTREKKQ